MASRGRACPSPDRRRRRSPTVPSASTYSASADFAARARSMSLRRRTCSRSARSRARAARRRSAARTARACRASTTRCAQRLLGRRRAAICAAVDQHAMRERDLHALARERRVDVHADLRIGLQVEAQSVEPVEHRVTDAAVVEILADDRQAGVRGDVRDLGARQRALRRQRSPGSARRRTRRWNSTSRRQGIRWSPRRASTVTRFFISVEFGTITVSPLLVAIAT